MFRSAIGVACAARMVLFDGFEGGCSGDDVDGDRLSGCLEATLKLEPLLHGTDDDGLLDGDEVLGTQDGLDLSAMGVDPWRKTILLDYAGSRTRSRPADPTTVPRAVCSPQPTQAVLDRVTVAFGASLVPNPDGSTGIEVVHAVGQGCHLETTWFGSWFAMASFLPGNDAFRRTSPPSSQPQNAASSLSMSTRKPGSPPLPRPDRCTRGRGTILAVMPQIAGAG